MKKITKVALGVGVGAGVVASYVAISLLKELKKCCEELDSDMFENEVDEDFDNFSEDENEDIDIDVEYITIARCKEAEDDAKEVGESNEVGCSSNEEEVSNPAS